MSALFALPACILFLASFNIAAAASPYGVTTSPSTANNQTFDYIIIGGGLTGTTVASRLSEDPNIRVLVIEAGGDNRNDPRVYDIYNYGQFFGTELDWSWPTVEGRRISGGKTFGGGSSINGAAYTRGAKEQYDAWSNLLESSEANVGWNWDGIFSYMQKSEAFSPPNPTQASKGAQYISTYHGYNGPLGVTFPDPNSMYGGPQQGYFINTIQNITGIKRYKDLNGGTPNCVSVTPLTINWHDQGHRASAPEAYYTPVQNSRTNLLILTKHQATKLLFSGTSLPLTATGVEFAASGGTTNTTTRYKAFAKREVILAAGAIQTPALLQLSGIGDSTLLNSLGIQTLINLPVGRNLQEQPMSTLGANPTNFNVGGNGPSDVIAYPNLAQLFNNNITAVTNKITQNIPAYAAKLASLGAGINELAIETILGVQRDLVVNPNVPVSEIFYDTGYPTKVGIIMWDLLPFSRGSVSIKSTNPFVYPTVKVNYFAADVDMDIQVATARLSRKILSTPPLSTLTTSEQIPGSAVPDNAQRGTDAAWKSWISQNYVSVAHPIGSASMMRRDLGGIVNAQLQVYDTNNVRIVDASVMPMQISAHLSATLYGVAEKAADLIKAAQ